MPRMDGTGPEGRGSMTGRGRGRCAGPARNVEDTMGRERGRGWGRSCRRGSGEAGHGWRCLDPVQDKDRLARHVEALEARLAAVKQHLAGGTPGSK